MPAKLAPARRVAVGEPLTIAGFGVTADGTARGLGIPRMATLSVTGQPGSLQIRLFDPVTHNQRIGQISWRLHRRQRRARLRRPRTR